MRRMRTIGLLGGMSWVSTEHYYRLINEAVGQELGTEHCAHMVLWQRDFAELAALQRAGRWDDAGEFLAAGARALVAAGADLLAICANTMHLVADAVEAAAPGVQLVHVVDVVRDACLAAGATQVALLGTRYTMESAELYPPRLAAAGIEMMVPDLDARIAIHRHTYEELTRGVITDEARETFRAACDVLVAAGADAVVLACTEHGLVLQQGDLDVPVLDSTLLHVRAVVDASLSSG
jgi:aspartate racemase